MSDLTTETPEISTPVAETPAVLPAPVVAPPPPVAKPKAATPVAADPAPAPAKEVDRPDPVAVALRSLQDDNAALALDLKAERAARAKAERERDAHAATVDVLGKRAAEGAIVSRLRDLVPAGVPEIDLRGTLNALHEAGKVDRYSADPDAAAKAAFDALKAANSSILRAAPPPGGPNGAPPQQAPARRHVSPAG